MLHTKCSKLNATNLQNNHLHDEKSHHQALNVITYLKKNLQSMAHRTIQFDWFDRCAVSSVTTCAFPRRKFKKNAQAMASTIKCALNTLFTCVHAYHLDWSKFPWTLNDINLDACRARIFIQCKVQYILCAHTHAES